MRYLDTDTNKKISKIGLGTWQLGSKEWGYGEQYATREAHAIVRRALELGVTLFDTAEIYGAGQSERILGRALGADRESVFLATKIFPIVPSAAIVKQRASASAKRLGVESLDLYQVHWPNPLITDGTVMRGMRSLLQTGLVDEVGVSAYSLERWRAAEGSLGSRILTNQVGYSLLDRSPERELLPFAETHDRVIIAFSPLERGLLSARYDSANRPTDAVRSNDPWFSVENLERLDDLMRTLRDIARSHDATPAQIALAWVIRSPAVAAIPGASTVEQLEQNVMAAEIELGEDEYQALRISSDRVRQTAVTSPPAPFKLGELKHLAKGAIWVAKTVWHDFRFQPPPSIDSP
jgi:aryl-alcohol dehydrogenase-like predicted oxidoreductase